MAESDRPRGGMPQSTDGKSANRNTMMSPDERKTMIAMAKGIDDLRKIVELAIKGNVIPTTPVMASGSGGGGDLRFVQTIEQTNKDKSQRMKFNVVFDREGAFPYEMRMRTAEDFLADLQEICVDYKVISLEGKYDRDARSLQT